MEDNERWLIDGDCSKCRRNSYCSKACTIRKRNGEKAIRNIIRSGTGIDILERAAERFGGLS